MKHFKKTTVAALCILAILSARAQDQWPDMMGRVSGLSARMDSLSIQKAALRDSAEALGQSIAFLEAQDLLSGRQRRQLSQQRRVSQAMTVRMDALEKNSLQVQEQYQLSLDALLTAIKNELDRTLAASSADPRQVARLQELYEIWSVRQPHREPSAGTWQAIAMEAGDSPRTLKLKGDLLTDRQATLNAESERVAERIASLEQELRIRSNVAFSDQEEGLFNQNEERFTRGRRTEAASVDNSYELDAERGDNDLAGSWTLWFDRPLAEMTAAPPQSPRTLTQWIERLKAYHSRLKTGADSLGVSARSFYEKAGEQPY